MREHRLSPMEGITLQVDETLPDDIVAFNAGGRDRYMHLDNAERRLTPLNDEETVELQWDIITKLRARIATLEAERGVVHGP